MASGVAVLKLASSSPAKFTTKLRQQHGTAQSHLIDAADTLPNLRAPRTRVRKGAESPSWSTRAPRACAKRAQGKSQVWGADTNLGWQATSAAPSPEATGARETSPSGRWRGVTSEGVDLRGGGSGVLKSTHLWVLPRFGGDRLVSRWFAEVARLDHFLRPKGRAGGRLLLLFSPPNGWGTALSRS